MSNETTQEDLGEKIPIDITDETYFALLQMYVEESLSKESIATYHDYINDGEDAIKALSRAVVNEMVIRACINEIERDEFAEAIKK